MNKLVKTVKKEDLYNEFLTTLNGILQLTDREKELMVLLLNIDRTTPKLPGYDKNIISTENRKYIMKTTGITKDNLSRYLGKFKDKGLLIKGKVDDEWLINPALIPEIIGDRLQITVILKVEK